MVGVQDHERRFTVRLRKSRDLLGAKFDQEQERLEIDAHSSAPDRKAASSGG